VQVEYVVPESSYPEWREAMDGMRRSRLRSGAIRWDVYRVGERVDTYLEVFTVPSWTEHLHQHEVRLTADDQAIEERAFSFVTKPVVAVHLLPPS
jgi:hypothetical protein